MLFTNVGVYICILFTIVTSLFTNVSPAVTAGNHVHTYVRNIPGEVRIEFYREFPYYMLVVRKPGELVGGAHLLRDLIDGGLAWESLVIFHS